MLPNGAGCGSSQAGGASKLSRIPYRPGSWDVSSFENVLFEPILSVKRVFTLRSRKGGRNVPSSFRKIESLVSCKHAKGRKKLGVVHFILSAKIAVLVTSSPVSKS